MMLMGQHLLILFLQFSYLEPSNISGHVEHFEGLALFLRRQHNLARSGHRAEGPPCLALPWEPRVRGRESQ